MNKKREKELLNALANIEAMMSEELIQARMKNTDGSRSDVVAYLFGSVRASLISVQGAIVGGHDFFCMPLSNLTCE